MQQAAPLGLLRTDKEAEATAPTMQPIVPALTPQMAAVAMLATEAPMRLFFPAGGAVLAAGNGPENEVALPNADAVASEQPVAPDLATILATMQHRFTQQRNTIAALKDELKAEFKGHLTSLAKHMSKKVN